MPHHTFRRFIAACAALLTLGATLAFTAPHQIDPKDWRVYTSDAIGCAFRYPNGWARTTNAQGVTAFLAPKQGLDTFQENISVVLQPVAVLKPEQTTLKGFVNSLEAYTREYFSQKKLRESTYIMLGTDSAVYTGYDVPKTAITGLPVSIRIRQMVIKRPEGMVSLTFTADVDSFAAYLPTAQAVQASLIFSKR